MLGRNEKRKQKQRFFEECQGGKMGRMASGRGRGRGHHHKGRHRMEGEDSSFDFLHGHFQERDSRGAGRHGYEVAGQRWPERSHQDRAFPDYVDPWKMEAKSKDHRVDAIGAERNTSILGTVCPLCKNHCPVDAPSCKKGEAYAASLQRG